MLLGSP
jgi:hypothetical protein